jgi:hypothetical protein
MKDERGGSEIGELRIEAGECGAAGGRQKAEGLGRVESGRRNEGRRKTKEERGKQGTLIG